MKILYIINGIGFASNVPLGGSDKRALEIGKRLLQAGHQVAVLTTEDAWRLLKGGGLNTEYFVIRRPYFIGESIKNNLTGRMVAYFYTCVVSCMFTFKDKFDVVFPTSDFFFDLLPAISAKLRGKANKMVSIVHHQIGNPLHRKGRLFINITLFILQRISFLIIMLISDGVFVYASQEGNKIRRAIGGFNGGKINSVLCGIDLEKMKRIGSQPKKFTACFVGGLRPAKGLWDIVPIWKQVYQEDKTCKLLIIGGGLSLYVERLRLMIKNSGLSENITLLTEHLDEGRLFESVASSRLLILPSYEEGWSIIICESLSLGVPAVVYDLDVFRIFSDAVIRAKIGDSGEFASKITSIIKDGRAYEEIRKRALVVGQGFDWSKAARRDEELLMRLVV